MLVFVVVCCELYFACVWGGIVVDIVECFFFEIGDREMSRRGFDFIVLFGGLVSLICVECSPECEYVFVSEEW